MRSQIVTSSLGLALVIVATSDAAPITLTFDDAGGSIVSLGTYGGLNWDNMFVVDITQEPSLVGSGYDNGLVSGTKLAFNASGNPAAASDGDFNFISAYFTAAWRDGLNINLEGINNGSSLFSTTITVDHDAPTQFVFNWTGIDELRFNSFGGVEVPNLIGNGTHFAMDNFTFSTSAVPEPTSMALFGLGALGLGVKYRRRRREQSAAVAA